jgi:hypothetical protein
LRCRPTPPSAASWSTGARRAIGSLLTPTNLFIGALAAIGIGGYEAISAVAKNAQEFDDLSARTDTATQSLRALNSAAAGKGIEDFSKTLEKFGDSSADASHNMGPLAELFNANGLSASGGMVSNLAKVAMSADRRHDVCGCVGTNSARPSFVQESIDGQRGC